MEENLSIKEAFERLARDGYIGDPNGELSYGYIRVSSAQQAEDGRSGLPRQIEHCHQAALERHLRIPWELLFADDGFSGFDFEHRPALSRLRAEMKNHPRSAFVVIEHLDRLSRNARWHQGFLLDEMTKYHITPIIWKSFGSEIERAVLGTIAEEGMRSEIARMKEGSLLKAKSGRVTAKRPRFGYMFVDSEGKVSEKVHTDTHYALHPEKANLVRLIFDQVLDEHRPLRQIAEQLNAKGVPPVFTGQVWFVGTVSRILRDPIYKGEFYAHRWYAIESDHRNSAGRASHIMKERPRSEWVKIDVPAIVTPEEWQLTQEILDSNRRHSLRNVQHRDWLLVSFLKCDICGLAYKAAIGGQRHPGRARFYYNCRAKNNERMRATDRACGSPYVRAEVLEAFVWEKVSQIILNPEIVLTLMEQSPESQEVLAVEMQQEYLEGQLREVASKYERWKHAYEQSVITLVEYQDHRAEFTKRNAELNAAREELDRKRERRLSLAQQRQVVLAGLANLQKRLPEAGTEEDLPFEEKRKLLKQLIDQIYINSKESTIRLEGVIKATYTEEETKFVFGSNRKSSNHRSANSRACG